jgi:hypothetical protein
MSSRYNGKSLADVIEQQKAEDRELYQRRQELQRQADERAAAERKANEKSPFEKILDKQELARHLVDSIQSGNPRNEEYMTQALKQICDVLDFLLDSR